MLHEACCSAPGSIMLLGEHAVLHGHPSVVAAIDQRMEVRGRLRDDQRVIIRSSLGEIDTILDELKAELPFQFIIAAIHQVNLLQGIELTVTASFSSTKGLGSSAAVTVATVAVLQKLLGASTELETIRQLAFHVIRTVQGRGSGADVAASVYGGLVYYQMLASQKKDIYRYGVAMSLRVEGGLRLGLFYSGSKMPTVDVIKQVENQFFGKADELGLIYKNIGQCAESGKKAIEAQDWPLLGKIFRDQQEQMIVLGVNNESLQQLIDELSAQTGCYGVKISGSGLGDCVVAVGTEAFFDAMKNHPAYIPIRMGEGLEVSCER